MRGMFAYHQGVGGRAPTKVGERAPTEVEMFEVEM